MLLNVPITFLRTIILSSVTVPTIEPDAPLAGCLNTSSTNKYAF